MSNDGKVEYSVDGNIGKIGFYHPKGNSLPSNLLYKLAEAVNELSKNSEIRVIILTSEGDGAFCAGASFDELLSIDNFDDGKRFFMGFATVINAMRKSPKLIIAAVHGRIVGGGVGLVSAVDYSIAVEDASLRLSELALSIGPFVIGPAVERKIGVAAYSYMTIDFEWRSAQWALEKGLYSKVVNAKGEMNAEVENLALKLSKLNPETIADLKKCFWEGTDDWDIKLEKRAEMSGKLILSDFTKNYIKEFVAKRKK